MIRYVDAGVLKTAYLEVEAAGGWPIVLLHGFPYDVHAYDEVAILLARLAGAVRVSQVYANDGNGLG